MRMTNGNRQRVGGILALRVRLGQQHADHHADLHLVGVAGADHRFLHLVGRIFRNDKASARRYQHRDAARLPELERRSGVTIDEGILDRGFVRRILLDHRDQPVMNGHQPRAEIGPLARFHRAAGDVNEPVAVALDQAPTGTAEARIDAENANRLADHAPLITPGFPPA